MLLWLINHYYKWLETHHLGFLRVFTREQDPFRQVAAILLSFLIVICFGPRLIQWLRRRKIGDAAGFDQTQIEELMKNKIGTPTMGGLLIVTAIVSATVLLADLTNFYVIIGLTCVLWLAAVGAADDWLKLNAARKKTGRQGLTGFEKLIFQVGLAIVLSIFTYRHGHQQTATSTLYFPFFKNLKPHLNLLTFAIIGTLVITGSSNAVNLTDGLDGLAAGCMGIISFGFMILALIISSPADATKLILPLVQNSDDMALMAGAMAGACMGFLWFNCNPAQVFMGDTGSLAMGGLIGYIALVIRQEFMLFFVGGIFVIEAVSVILQVSIFKYTRLRYGTGKRFLLMSPLHNHFLKKGWGESQIVVRFWLLSAMLAAMALATIKLR